MNKPERAKTPLPQHGFKVELDALRSQIITEILNSRESDIEEREKAYLKVRFLDEIIAHFQSIADSDQIVKKRWKIL